MQFKRMLDGKRNSLPTLQSLITASTRRPVSQDSNCELGKWLKGEGQVYARNPEFAKLVADHAHFHAAAGEVIRKADSGQCVSELVCLGAKSDYSAASNAVVTALMKLKAKAAA
jgi:hypothetical protein